RTHTVGDPRARDCSDAGDGPDLDAGACRPARAVLQFERGAVMTRQAMLRLAFGAAVVLALLGATASSALPPGYTIYPPGHTQPVQANPYSEEPPGIFFGDDDSQYVFAVGCDRVQKVERGGAAIPPPMCPVDRLPTTMPRVYLTIMDLEAKRLDDSIARLREQTRAYAQAGVGTFAATAQ